jgi:hypothetical protein
MFPIHDPPIHPTIPLEGTHAKFIVYGAIQDHPQYNCFTFMSFFCGLV